MVPQARAQDCRHPANAFEELIGRRSSSRHAIDLCARYVTPEASVRVKLEDISASGAAFAALRLHSATTGEPASRQPSSWNCAQ